ncbi:MAG: hypothetical protein IJ489_03370 [Clostridia bacterium]|nr:hypothetical protein [Clostridia bacterium]
MNFKKIISLILALSLCAVLLCSCNKKDEDIPDGMQLVTSEFMDSKFFVPNDWTPEITTGTLVAKAEDNSNVSVQKMTPSGSYSSADSYFRTDYFPKLTSTFKNIVLLEEECSIENQTFGKEENGAVKYVYTVESDGSTYKIMQYFSVYSGYLYILTYTAEESVFADHLEDVSSIVKNFVY